MFYGGKKGRKVSEEIPTQPDCPRPVRRGPRLFADQIRRSEFARAVMTHASERRNSQCAGFTASAFQERCCRAGADSDYGRDLKACSCACESSAFASCTPVSRSCVPPQVLVGFHEGIVRRWARPLQSMRIALESCMRKPSRASLEWTGKSARPHRVVCSLLDGLSYSRPN